MSTIEEYQQLSQMPKSVCVCVCVAYFNNWHNRITRQLIKLVNTKDMTSNWKTWEDIFNQKMKKTSSSIDRIKILGLSIFGVILFPSVAHLISLEVENMFLEMERNEVNLLATVITKIVLSLNHYRTTGRGFMRCCVIYYTCGCPVIW